MVMTRTRWSVLWGVAIALSGCVGLKVHDRASGQPVALTLCHKGETLLQRSTLYFGAARPDGGMVSDAEWTRFLVEVVTPAFPDGMTWFDAHGQWRGDAGDVVRESSRLIVLLHATDKATQRRIDSIARHYKRAFAQESVLQERSAVCARL
jgi:Protein of unknown function (DUF3574)